MTIAMAPPPLLSVERLSVRFAGQRGPVEAVKDLSFHIEAGETLAVVGESGSGKSVTALSILRLIEREGGVITPQARLAFARRDGSIVDLARLDAPSLQRIRGNEIAMIFQEPMTALNPVMTVGRQIAEVLVTHRGLGATAALAEAKAMLDLVRIPDGARRLSQYPHELSGGMRQRVMIAMALACRPRLLIADEPTTALDVTIQSQILDLIRLLQQEIGLSVLFITHDMGVVAGLADRVVVMRHGRKLEEAATRALFATPRDPYTRDLLAAVPRLGAGAPGYRGSGETVLKADGVTTRFAIRKGLFKRVVAEVHAVDDVSIELRQGETLGLVGESGCGKSTLGRSLMRLIEPRAGDVMIGGRRVSGLKGRALRHARRDVQMIFQDPFASLNPRMKVVDLVTEPLAIHGQASAAQRRAVAADLLARVGLQEEHLDRYPHQFSGGQRQRLCIARALSVKPKVIIADEPVSALDVSIAAQVIALLRDLQERDGIAFLFVAHDIAVVERVSHRIAVMHLGRIVETGPTDAVLNDPRHPYTQRLLAAVPVADPSRPRLPPRLDATEIKSPIRPLGEAPPSVTRTQVGNGHFVWM